MVEVAIDGLLNLIGNYGFPIVVALWFMFRTEKVIKGNTEALIKMTDIVIGLERRLITNDLNRKI